jgi:multiple sugar transport system substrate-binding protein
MKRLALFVIVVSFMVLTVGPAMAATEIVVAYPYPEMFDTSFNLIKEKFEAEHPNIKVKYEPGYRNYEEATQRLLRQALTNQLPDVSFQGINRLRIYVERDLPIPLDPFIAKEKNWSKHGLNDAMVEVGSSGGKVYGFPFAVSTPVVMFNKNLVRQAGGDPDKFPNTWPEIMKLASKIDDLGDKIYGMHYVWTITGNWMWQSLIYSNCGQILDSSERNVAFNDAVGLKAFQLLDEMVKKGKMHDLTQADAYNSMYAGALGMIITSVAGLSNIEKKGVGKFEVGTAVFPEVKPGCGRVPTGGNLAMMYTKDPKKRAAAWEFIKFVTSPIGQTYQAGNTGYMPTNELTANDPDLLGKFYDENPAHKTTLRQMEYVTGWYSFPGENALKITDVIRDHLQSVVNQSATPEAALQAMTEDVQRLLPK